MMLHTKYQGSSGCGLRQEYFFMVLPIEAHVNQVSPGAGHFWPPIPGPVAQSVTCLATDE